MKIKKLFHLQTISNPKELCKRHELKAFFFPKSLVPKQNCLFHKKLR